MAAYLIVVKHAWPLLLVPQAPAVVILRYLQLQIRFYHLVDGALTAERSEQRQAYTSSSTQATKSKNSSRLTSPPRVARLGSRIASTARDPPTDPIPTQPGSRSPKLPIASMYSSMR